MFLIHTRFASTLDSVRIPVPITLIRRRLPNIHVHPRLPRKRVLVLHMQIPQIQRLVPRKLYRRRRDLRPARADGGEVAVHGVEERRVVHRALEADEDDDDRRVDALRAGVALDERFRRRDGESGLTAICTFTGV